MIFIESIMATPSPTPPLTAASMVRASGAWYATQAGQAAGQAGGKGMGQRANGVWCGVGRWCLFFVCLFVVYPATKIFVIF